MNKLYYYYIVKLYMKCFIYFTILLLNYLILWFFHFQSDRKRSRRTCGECVACLTTEDCGLCDFCKVILCFSLCSIGVKNLVPDWTNSVNERRLDWPVTLNEKSYCQTLIMCTHATDGLNGWSWQMKMSGRLTTFMEAWFFLGHEEVWWTQQNATEMSSTPVPCQITGEAVLLFL